MAKFLIILFILHSTTAIEAQWDNSTSEEITNSTSKY